MDSPGVEGVARLRALGVVGPILQAEGVARDNGAPVLLRVLRDDARTPSRSECLNRDFLVSKQVGSDIALVPTELVGGVRAVALVYPHRDGRFLNLCMDENWSLARTLRFASALCDTLSALHGRGLAHLRLCPASVFYDEREAQVRLVDLGAARLRHSPIPFAQTRWELEASLAYTSPEQTGRLGHKPADSADLYSAGILLHELLTGQRPFKARDVGEWLHAHLALEPTPPRELDPSIPAVVSEMVCKLLEKEPARRYRTARGLQKDIRRCLEAIEEGRELSSFELGRDDLAPHFTIPARLYGRDALIEELLTFGTSPRGGRPGLVLLEGQPGSGKSALAGALWLRGVPRGRVMGGKYEQFGANTPYHAFAQALHQLAEQLLAEPASSLEALREKVAREVGASISVLVELVPGLAVIADESRAQLPLLGPAENRARLNEAVRGLLAALSSPDSPLVIVLDDLQWGDEVSVELLKFLLQSEGLADLLFVGCVRHEEIGEEHPLSRMLDQLGREGPWFKAVELAPLNEQQVAQLLDDSACGACSRDELASYAWERTGGNPFDLHRLLLSMVKKEELWLDESESAWTWKRGQGELSTSRVDAVELISQALAELPGDSVEILNIAMCLGASCELQGLAVACDCDGEAILLALEPAIEAQLVVVDRWQLAFSHDRVPQALAVGQSEGARRVLHWQVGRRLLRHASEQEGLRSELIFDIVNHLNLGRPDTLGSAEALEYTRANLEACRKAVVATAYERARRYGEAAASMLEQLATGPDSEAEALRMAVPLELARVDYLLGDFEGARSRLAVCEEQARSYEERGRLYSLLKDVIVSEGEPESYELAIRVGLELLEPELPDFVGRCADTRPLAAYHAHIDELLGERRPAELIRLAPLDDSRLATTSRLVIDLWEAAYYAGNSELMKRCIGFLVQSSLEQGNTAESSMAFVMYGAELLALGQTDKAYAWGEAGLLLNRQRKDEAQLPKVNNLFCNFLAFYRVPFERCRELYEESARVGRQHGDYLFGLWAAVFDVWTSLLCSDRLDEVLQRARKHEAFVRATRDEKMIRAFELLLSVARHLSSPTEMKFGTGLEDETLEFWRDCGFVPGPTWNAVLRAQVELVSGDAHQAYQRLMDPGLCTDVQIAMFPVSQLPFYRGLAAAKIFDETSVDERAGLLEQMRLDLAELEALAEHCSDNFGYQAHLVRASLLAVEGQCWEAAKEFDAAIGAAEASGPVFALAISNEMGGCFWVREGNTKVGGLYLERALGAYAQWGATSKVESLMEWAVSAGVIEDKRARDSASSVELVDSSVALAALRRVAEVVEEERDLDALLHRTLRIAMEYAAAERGVLLVRRGEGSEGVVLLESLEQEQTPMILGQEGSFEGVPRSLLRVVERSGQGVIIDDAQQDLVHRRDPYFLAHPTRSVLCQPVVYRSDVIAFVILENKFSAGVFSERQLEVLRVVLSQLSVFLESSRLYDALLEEVDERRQAEEALAASEFRSKRGQYFANVGVWDWNVTTGDIYWSERIAPLFGYPEGELNTSYENFIKAVHPDDREKVENAIQACFDGADYRVDHRVVWPDGRVRWASESGDVIRDEEGRPTRMLGVITDITERVAGEEERQRLTRQLQQAQKMEAIGQLTGGIAHDFNNILGVTVGFAELAVDACRDGNFAVVPERLQRVLESSLKAKELVKQLLTFSRSQAGQAEALDISGSVRESLRFLSATLPSSMNVRFHATEGLPRVLADAIDLNQVVMNCCINSRHAMEGRGDLDIRVQQRHLGALTCSSCHERVLGSFVEVSIADSGSGISPETLERIFEPFFTTKPTGEGSGMGLSIVHGVMHRLRGHIRVESAEGKGTTVRLFFPAQSSKATAGLVRSADAMLALETVGERTRVLVVDDEPALVQLHGLMLESLGCEVVACVDPRVALDLLRGDPQAFDLMLVDLTMPHLTGLDLAEGARQAGSQLPIVLCTGNVGDSAGEAAEAGIREILCKPIQKADLRGVLDRIAVGDPAQVSPGN